MKRKKIMKRRKKMMKKNTKRLKMSMITIIII
jgi:hypothetical protein